MHIYGDEHPETGLRNKVKGFQFANKIDVMDPVTKQVTKEPMKPFMVNQLIIAFERERIIMSPFDETLHKQLIDYEVVRTQQNGAPIFTSENEHFVDTLGLAHLAFVLEFPQLAGTIKEIENSSKIAHTNTRPGQAAANRALTESPFKGMAETRMSPARKDDDDLKGDKPRWVKVSNSPRRRNNSVRWGSRKGGAVRSIW